MSPNQRCLWWWEQSLAGSCYHRSRHGVLISEIHFCSARQHSFILLHWQKWKVENKSLSQFGTCQRRQHSALTKGADIIAVIHPSRLLCRPVLIYMPYHIHAKQKIQKKSVGWHLPNVATYIELWGSSLKGGKRAGRHLSCQVYVYILFIKASKAKF